MPVLGGFARCGLFAALAPLALGAGSGPAAFRVVKNVSYQTAEPEQRADLYLPAEPPAHPVPAVVWMHGNHHDKADAREQNVCSSLAAAGYVCLSINYGTWPDSDAGEEHNPRIRQNLANARSALGFLRQHAAEYGVDGGRLALFGGSAGAWTALMVGFSEGPGSVRAIGDFYSDLDPWVKSKIGAGAPPVLIVQGKADPAVPYRDSVWLSDQLAARGVPHELVLLEGVGHGFDLTTWQRRPLPRDLRPVVLDFLRKYLGPARP